ncbi:hypothetical protein MTO96_003465 [Rhipicephalus appendiculatus]
MAMKAPGNSPVHIPMDEKSNFSRQGKDTTGQERPRVPAFCKQLIGLERAAERDRKCALLLAVGLLTAVFFVASAFSASAGSNVGLPPDQSHENAVNAEYDAEANANNVSGKPNLTSIVNRAVNVTRRPSTSSRSTQNESLFFSSKNCADSGTDVVTEVMPLSPSVTTNDSPEHSSVAEESVTESSENVSPPLANNPVFSGDDHLLSYGGDTTSVDSDVF